MKKLPRKNRHHRKGRCYTGGIPFDGNINGVPNVVMVDYKKHCAFHTLFTDSHPISIANELNETWINPEYLMVAIPKETARKIQNLLKQLT